MGVNEVALWPPQHAQLVDTLVIGDEVDSRLPKSCSDDQGKLRSGGVVSYPL